VQHAAGVTGSAADGNYGPITRNAMRFRSNDIPTLCFHY
jgi:hypothetical protein